MMKRYISRGSISFIVDSVDKLLSVRNTRIEGIVLGEVKIL